MTITRALARRLWPPLLGWQIAVMLAAIVCIVIEMEATSSHPFVLGSLRYYTEAAVVFGTIAGLILLWIAPLTGGLLLTVAAFGSAAVPGISAIPAGWLAIAALALVLTGRLALARRPLAPTAVARVDGELAGSLAERRPTLGILLVAVLAVAAIALPIVHQILYGQTLAFQERAVAQTVEVLSIDDDGFLTVRTESGTHELDGIDLAEEPEVGGTVTVLIDPDDPADMQLTESPDDPSWLLGLAFVTLPLAWVAAERFWLPALRRRRLVGSTVPTFEARLLVTDDGKAYLLPLDGVWPAVRVDELDGLVAPDASWEEDDAEEPPLDEDVPLPESAEELRAWLTDEEPSAEDEREFESAFGPAPGHPHRVTVFGTPHHGATIAVGRGSDVWLTEVGLGVPEFGLRRKLHAPATEGAGLLAGLLTFHPRAVRWLWAAFWVAAWAVLARLHFAWEIGSWFTVLALTGLWAVGLVGWGIGDGAVTLLRDRLILHGVVLDDVVAPAQVAFGVAADELVGLRLRDPDDVMVLSPASVLRRSDATPAEALAALERWRLDTPPGVRPGRRPAAPLWGAVGIVVVGVGNVLLGAL